MLEKAAKYLQTFFTPNRVSISICMVVALIGWFLTKMSKVYTHQLSIDISYTIPQQITFTEDPPLTIDVDLRGTGWSLLRLALNQDEDTISFIAEDLADRSISTKILLSEKLSKIVGTQISILNADPEQIAISLVDKESKKVPVVLKGQIDLNPQFQWKDSIKLEPDSVLIYGPTNQLTETTFWPTKDFSRTDVQQDLTSSIELEPSTPSLEVGTSFVSLTALVDQITEKEIYVPIQIIDSLKGHISIFPDEALVKINLGLSKFDHLNPEEFSLVAEPDPDDSGTLRVVLKEIPPYVTYLAHVPVSVDFIRSNP